MDRPNWGKQACFVFVLCATTAIALRAQTFETLHSFDGTDGSQPNGGLVQATDGNYYGTTYLGGAQGDGTVFKMTPDGRLTTLHSFCSQSSCRDGGYPSAGLVQATDGNFYGTTGFGGVNSCVISGTNYGCGTVFKMTPDGTLTTLYSFCAQSGCTDGFSPQAALLEASDGNFYGTTAYGGANDTCGSGVYAGCGTVFQITPSGTLTTLYSFCSQSGCTDGEWPYARLIQATDGNFYGTTVYGGTNGNGTVFEITPPSASASAIELNSDGTTTYGGANGVGTSFDQSLASSWVFTTKYRFCSLKGCIDGSNPAAGLGQAKNGNFYGTTVQGGANSNGTFFMLTPGGTLTTVTSFCSLPSCVDGAHPDSDPYQDIDGNLFGTTDAGGAGGGGVVYEVTPDDSGGTVTTFHTFCSQKSCTDGSEPVGVVAGPGGILYGPTAGGGAYGNGTVWRSGAWPVVSLSPTSLNFPLQWVGTSDEKKVTLSNIGKADLSIYGFLVSGNFSQVNKCGPSVAAGDSCGLYITFTPTVPGLRRGTLVINDNNLGARDSVQTVSLTGFGWGPNVQLSAGSLTFCPTPINTASPPEIVTLGNFGNAPLKINGIAASGDFAQENNCSTSVAPGKKCDVKVEFTPRETGTLTGTLTISDNAYKSPQSVSLSGTGVLPGPPIPIPGPCVPPRLP